MKPAPFAYADPTTVDEVLDLLAAHGPDAAVLAGGQTLVPELNLRRVRPAVVIDLRRVEGLDTVDLTDGPDGTRTVVAGASALAVDLGLVHPDAAVADAVACIGHPQIRTRTTVGGCVATADPAAELSVVLTALDGTVALRSAGGERPVSAAEWFVGHRHTARRPDELVTAVTFGTLGGPSAFAEVSRRPQDLPIVAVFAGLGADGWRVAVGGVAPVPVRARRCERALDAGDVAAAVVAVASEISPPSDRLASSAHRRSMAAATLRRVLGDVGMIDGTAVA